MRCKGRSVYLARAMNDNSSTNPSIPAPHHGLTAEAISRRAYEIWEKEGRPESRDLHHWLRAEQELLAEQKQGGHSADTAPAAQSAQPANTDTQPLQGTRAAAAVNRDQQRTVGKRAAPPTHSNRGR